VALANGRWPFALLAAGATVGFLLAPRRGPLAAGLLVVTALLPTYDAGWLATLGHGFGLFTVFVGALTVVAVLTYRLALWRLARDRGAILIAVFALIVVGSLLVDPRGDHSVGTAKTIVARAFLLPLLLLLVAYAIPRDRARHLVDDFGTAVIVIALVGVPVSIAQVAFGKGYIDAASPAVSQFVGKRAIGFSSHPAAWAAFLLIPVGIASARWLRERTLWFGLAALAIAFEIVLTGLRSGWLALALMAVLGVFAAKGWMRAAGIAAIVVSLGVAFLIGNFRTELQGGNPSGALGLGKGRLGIDESARQREILTHAEVDLGLRAPLTGIGLGNVSQEIGTLHKSYLRDQHLIVPGSGVTPHNSFTGLFAELGAPGLSAFLALFAAAFLALLRGRRAAATPRMRAVNEGLLAALSGTAVLAIVTDADRQVYLWWILGVALLLDALRRQNQGAVDAI
jgi:O-antigen ligase